MVFKNNFNNLNKGISNNKELMINPFKVKAYYSTLLIMMIYFIS